MEGRAVVALPLAASSLTIPTMSIRTASRIVFHPHRFVRFFSSSIYKPVPLRRATTVRCLKEDPSAGIRRDPVLGEEQALEAELAQAIQSEDYAKAAIVRDRLRGLQQENVTAVLEANARFYRAFEQGDLAAMRRLWSKGDNVHCIHPGAGRISGHELVISSWEVMLGPDVDLPLRISLEHVQVRVSGDLGLVSCLEVVRSGTSWGKQVATNVFERQDGVWHICMHHASPASGS